jgi:integrase/recombinase XerD
VVGNHRSNHGRVKDEWGVALLPLSPVIVSGRVNLTTPFVHIRVEDLLLDGDPPQLRILHAKRGADRYVPILPALGDELSTHLHGRHTGFLFESNRHTRYSTRMVQAIVTACARTAGIQKRVYPRLLRHSIATILLDSGLMPIDQVQKLLGHLHLSTTQIYAETSLRALGDNYIRAIGGKW